MISLSRAIVLLFLSLFFIIPIGHAANSCVDINTAPKEELEKIKHIGESRAEQIIKLREEKLFSSVDELERVVGIGPARIADIKEEGTACVRSQPPLQSADEGKLPTSGPTDASPTSGKIEAKNNFNSSSAEKQLASAKDQLPKPESSLMPFLAAAILAIVSGVSILVIKNKTKTGLNNKNNLL